MSKPFLKWVGGKTQIIEKVISLFPRVIKDYHEPFIGGGSVLIALLNNKDITVNSVFAYDNNPDLINVYQQLKTNPLLVCEHVETLVRNHTQTGVNQEKHYYQVRQAFNDTSTSATNLQERAAQFLFLNKTCFRGVYRVGPNGFNVPYGHYKTMPNILDKNEAVAYSQLFQRVQFKCCDFEEALSRVSSKEDFVYLDPPYAPETKTSFVGYTKDGFKKHEQVFECCHRLRERNIPFVLSNACVEMVTSNFQNNDYTIQEIECKRTINSKNPESKTIEVLIYPK